MNSERIQLVVIDEHTLGLIRPETPTQGEILHTSILKGSYFSPYNPILLSGKKVRLATKQDFEDYRCSMVGFDNENEFIFGK